MNPSDVPPTVLMRSALQAFTKAEIEATILYTVEKNGKRITRAESNNGPAGMARQLATVRIQDGAIERAAVALHEFRVQLPDGAAMDDEARAGMDRCPMCGLAENWNALSDLDREGHREIVKVIVGNALAGPPAASGIVV